MQTTQWFSWETCIVFAGKLAHYHYLNHPDSYPNYTPYDDLKSNVCILSALPGSGKDTRIRTHYRDLPILSPDDIYS